jgi:hypothetical protein
METTAYELLSLSETVVIEPQDDTTGVTALDATEAKELPFVFVATTVKV